MGRTKVDFDMYMRVLEALGRAVGKNVVFADAAKKLFEGSINEAKEQILEALELEGSEVAVYVLVDDTQDGSTAQRIKYIGFDRLQCESLKKGHDDWHILEYHI